MTVTKIPMKRRRQFGSQIAEFGVVLFVLLLIVLFPLIDFLSMGLSYMCGCYLNFAQVRDASARAKVVIPAAQEGEPPPTATISNQTEVLNYLDSLTAHWFSMGLGRFTNPEGQPDNTVSLDLQQGNGSLQYVKVTTNIQMNPFLQIPFFVTVPGLNAPMSFTYVGERPAEYVEQK